MPWEVTSYLTQGKPWANASNTPYRKYKTTNYEGGTHTPMIACWPGKTEAGAWTDQVGHLIDFTPTLLELAGAEVPAALPGRSLVSALKGEGDAQRRVLYWQFGKAAAMRDGDWKIVRQGKGPWELYNLAEDPTEMNDLAKKHPEVAEEMAQRWDGWWADKGSVAGPVE